MLIFFRNDLERETNLRPTDLQLIRLQCYQDVDMRSLNFCSESPDSGLKKNMGWCEITYNFYNIIDFKHVTVNQFLCLQGPAKYMYIL